MIKVRHLLTLLMATIITAGQVLLVVNDTAAVHHSMEHDQPSL